MVIMGREIEEYATRDDIEDLRLAINKLERLNSELIYLMKHGESLKESLRRNKEIFE